MKTVQQQRIDGRRGFFDMVMSRQRYRQRKGVTLIEVLIVVAIIGILIQLALPAIQAAREAARRTQCASNMRQMGIAVHSVQAAHGKLPQAAGYWPMETGPFQDENHGLPLWDPDNPDTILSKEAPANFSTAMYFLLPYLEEEAQYMEFWGSTQGYGSYIPDPPYDQDGQWSERARAPAVQLCPSDTASKYKGLINFVGRNLGVSNYPVNIQALGHFRMEQPTPERKRRIPQDFPDGTSKTVLFAERYAICQTAEAGRNAWLGTIVHPGAAPFDPFFAVNNSNGTPNIVLPQDAPKMAECDPARLQSSHPGVMNVVLADGSTRPVNVNVSLETWTNLVLPDDGKTLGTDW